MASGPATKFPTTSSDGTISVERTVKDEDGNLVKINQIIFDEDSPTVSSEFAQEIVDLINSGEVSAPVASNQYLVNISDQVEFGKYIYQVVDKTGAAKVSSDIFRVFFNGLNVTIDVTLSEDGKSFEFSEDYDPSDFNDSDFLVIDYVEES
jgi:hypothetical protein